MMFDTIIQYLESLSSGKATQFSADERNLAIAGLFYHMIAADGVVKPVEKMRFGAILEEKFGLTADTLATFSARASDVDLRSSGLFPFTSIINHGCSTAEKIKIIEQLKSLSQADGESHPLEKQLIRNVEELLKVESEGNKDAAE